jgi:glycosyltransferase 2 family protein
MARVAGPVLSLAVVAAVAVALRGRWTAAGVAGGLPGWRASLGAVMLYAAANAVLAAAWRRIVALLYPPPPYWALAWVWAVSQLSRYAVGPGQIAGRALLARRYGVPAVAGAVTGLVELAWLISLTAALGLATLPWWLLQGAKDLRWLAWAGAVPTAVLAVGLVRPQALVVATGRLVAWRPLDRLTGGRLRGAATRISVAPSDAARLTAVYGANNLLRIGAFLVLFAAAGGDPRRDLLLAVGAYSVGQLVGWLAVFAPGGLGPREGATFLVVGPVLGAGAALLLVAVMRVLELAGELVFLLIARARLPMTRRRRWR